MKREDTPRKILLKNNLSLLKTKICNIILTFLKKRKVMRTIIQRSKIKIVRFQNNYHSRL